MILGENKDDKGLLATRLLSRPDAEVFRWWVDRKGEEGTERDIFAYLRVIERNEIVKRKAVNSVKCYSMSVGAILCQGEFRIKGAVVEFQVVRSGVYLEQ